MFSLSGEHTLCGVKHSIVSAVDEVGNWHILISCGEKTIFAHIHDCGGVSVTDGVLHKDFVFKDFTA